MMGIPTTDCVDMQSCLGVIDESVEKFPEQINIEITDTAPRKVNMIF